MCPRHVSCETKCRSGYAIDARGCPTCECAVSAASNDEDIIFTDGEAEEILKDVVEDADADAGNTKKNEDERGEEGGEERRGNDENTQNEKGEKKSMFKPSSGASEDHDEVEPWTTLQTSSSSEVQTESPESRVTLLKQNPQVSFPGVKEGMSGPRANSEEEEPCNTTTTRKTLVSFCLFLLTLFTSEHWSTFCSIGD